MELTQQELLQSQHAQPAVEDAKLVKALQLVIHAQMELSKQLPQLQIVQIAMLVVP